MTYSRWAYSALLHSLLQSHWGIPRSPLAIWTQPGWCGNKCSSENPKACVTSCSILGKWCPVLPVCLEGGIPHFLLTVVWQEGDEDWTRHFRLLVEKTYPHGFQGVSQIHHCVRVHLHVYSLVCCSHSEFGSVLRDHRVHLRWKRWEEVSFLWDLCVGQKGDGSTGRAGRGARGASVKYVSSSFLLQPTDFLVQFQGTSKWVFTSQM